MKKFFNYIKDVRQEWFKIVWPNRDTVIRSTILIFVFSALFALFLFLVDTVVAALVNWVL